MQCDSTLEDSLEIVPALLLVEMDDNTAKFVWKPIKDHLVCRLVSENYHGMHFAILLVLNINLALGEVRLLIHHKVRRHY